MPWHPRDSTHTPLLTLSAVVLGDPELQEALVFGKSLVFWITHVSCDVYKATSLNKDPFILLI